MYVYRELIFSHFGNKEYKQLLTMLTKVILNYLDNSQTSVNRD